MHAICMQIAPYSSHTGLTNTSTGRMSGTETVRSFRQVVQTSDSFACAAISSA